MFSLGMFSFLPAKIAVRNLGLESGSPPPTRAAIVISRITLVKMRPRLASVAAFLCLIVAHLECPDISCLALSLENLPRLRPSRNAARDGRTHSCSASLAYLMAVASACVWYQEESRWCVRRRKRQWRIRCEQKRATGFWIDGMQKSVFEVFTR